MNREGLVYTVVVTFVVSFVFVGALAFANELTKAMTAENALLFQKRAILSAMGIEYADDSEVFDLYAQSVSEETRGETVLLTADVNGEAVRAIRFRGSGLWGEIYGILAVRPDLSRVVGMDIIDHNETPGLGGRISEDWFKEQFRDEKILNGRLLIEVGSGRGDSDSENGTVDSVTGATRTSDAMETILNGSLAELQEVLQ